jgi:hypothetical protein
VQVLTNPYSPEYGKFTGGVTSIETNRVPTRAVTFQDFSPAVEAGNSRNRIGHSSPAVSGPVIGQGKVLQSFEYNFTHRLRAYRRLNGITGELILSRSLIGI